MCSRFELNSSARAISVRFGLRTPLPNLPGRVIRPTDPALVITSQGPRLLRFGLTVDWDNRPVINARAETVASRATFKPLLEHRCLVPADAWIEWQKVTSGRKPMWRLHPHEDGLFALAGLMRGEEFVVLTCAPSPAIAFVHDRMPVVLAAEAEAAWLDPARDFATVSPALVPYEAPLDAVSADDGAPPHQPGLFD
jgi:putative SOS response-associated peptidase YedK